MFPAPNHPRLIRVDATTGARTTLTENTAPSGGPDLEAPKGIAFEADGHLVVADSWLSDISAELHGDRVVRVDPNTGARTLVSKNGGNRRPVTLYGPRGIAVEADGNLLVADASGGAQPSAPTGGRGGIVRIDPRTGSRSLVSDNFSPAGTPPFNDVSDLAVADDGTIFVVDGRNGVGVASVIRVDPQTGARTLVSQTGAPAGGPDLVASQGITFDGSGDLLVTTNYYSGHPADPGIIRIDSTTGVRTTVAQSPFNGPFAAPNFSGALGDLAFNRSTGHALTNDWGNSAVLGVDAASGTRSIVSDNAHTAGQPEFLYNYFGIAIRPLLIGQVVLGTTVFHTGGGGGGPKGQNDRAAAAAARGTTLSYRLSQAARVTVRIDRLRAGRIVGLTCRAQTRSNRKRRPCKVISRVGTVRYTSKAGRNRHAFTGVVAGKRLAPGTYRATLIATGHSGYRSVPVSRPFRVLSG